MNGCTYHMHYDGVSTTCWRKISSRTEWKSHCTSCECHLAILPLPWGTCCSWSLLWRLYLVSIMLHRREKKKEKKTFCIHSKMPFRISFPLVAVCFYSPCIKSGFESSPAALLKWFKHPGKGRIVARECAPQIQLQHCFMPLVKEHLRPTRKPRQRLCNPAYALVVPGSLCLGLRVCSVGGVHA